MRQAFPDLGAKDYWGLILRKLPRGILWAQQRVLTGATYADGLPVPLTRLSQILLGLSDELARAHNHLNRLPAEAWPGTATADGLLPLHEKNLGLPEFGYVPTTEAERQVLAEAKAGTHGGASAQYFLAMALRYGFTLTYIADGPWRSWWTVKSPELTRARAGSFCAGDPIVDSSSAFRRVWRAFDHYRQLQSPIWWTD